MLTPEGHNKYRFFICSQGSITDLEEIYSISMPIEGYGEYKGQWQFKAVAKLDGKPLQFIYDTLTSCLEDQQKMSLYLIKYKLQLDD